MNGIIDKKDLPENTNLSPYYLEKSERFACVQHQGRYYYFPFTEELEKFYEDIGQVYAEDILSNLIGIVYLQIRDTVGSQINQQLSTMIGDGFERIFAQGLNKEVEKRFLALDQTTQAEEKR